MEKPGISAELGYPARFFLNGIKFRGYRQARIG
jgi:hypothetical protein